MNDSRSNAVFGTVQFSEAAGAISSSSQVLEVQTEAWRTLVLSTILKVTICRFSFEYVGFFFYQISLFHSMFFSSLD